MNSFWAVTNRNLKVFLRDKAAVFFSFLSILIVFILNILFIGNNIQDGIKASFAANGLAVGDKLVRLFGNSWMVSGVIGIGTITISSGSVGVLVDDNITGARADFFVTPTNRTLIVLSYFVSTVTVTFLMSLGMLVIAYGYLLMNGMTAIAFIDMLSIIGIIMLSTLSSTMIMITAALFIKSQHVYSVVCALLGVVIGFASGAYMPLDMFPESMGNIFSFVPTTGAVVMLRKHFMSTVITEMSGQVPPPAVDMLIKEFGMKLKIGGTIVPHYAIILYLAAVFVVFLVAAALLLKRAKNK